MTALMSTLSPNEVWKAAFDDVTETLKVSLQAAIVGVQQEVIINASEDSVTVFQQNGASLHVYVDNFASFAASTSGGTVFQGTSPWVIGGTVTVANPFLGPIGITGSVGVTFAGVTVLNFPSVQAVTGPIGVTFGTVGTTFPVGFTGQSNTRANISNVTSTILAANSNRKYVYLFNQSGVNAFFKLGASAVVNEGFRLPNNSVYEITRDNLWLGSIDAIKSGGATVQIEVFEGT